MKGINLELHPHKIKTVLIWTATGHSSIVDAHHATFNKFRFFGAYDRENYMSGERVVDEAENKENAIYKLFQNFSEVLLDGKECGERRLINHGVVNDYGEDNIDADDIDDDNIDENDDDEKHLKDDDVDDNDFGVDNDSPDNTADNNTAPTLMHSPIAPRLSLSCDIFPSKYLTVRETICGMLCLNQVSCRNRH